MKDEDTEKLLLTVGQVPILKVCVCDSKLKLTWLDKACEQWPELQNSGELIKLIEIANEKPAKSAASQNEGKGKCPQGS